jgi:hypothetical protein
MQKTTDEKKAQRIAAYFAMLEEPVQVRAGDDFYRRLHFRLHSHAAESTSERKWPGLLRTALMVSIITLNSSIAIYSLQTANDQNEENMEILTTSFFPQDDSDWFAEEDK